MKNFYFKAIFLCFCLSSSINAFAYDAEIDGIYYNFISENEAEVTSYYDYSTGQHYYFGTVVIPESVTYNGRTYRVTNIGESVFYNCKDLTSITIPNSVTSIGNYAFEGCSGLTSINVASGNSIYDSRNNCNAIIESKSNTLLTGCQNTIIPESVNIIDYHAFSGCTSLTTISIPHSVKEIRDSAFQGCSGLISLIISNGVASIGNCAFMGCSGLTSITIPGSVGTICNSAFEDCTGLASLIIGNGVTDIGHNAFSGCSLTSITIPNSVISINSFAFAYCSGLTSIKVEDGNPKYDSRDSSNAIIETETNTLIQGCQNTIFPNSVTSIGSGAFSGCTSLTSFTIPNNVTSIGSEAFSGCTSLTSIDISESVTSIGSGAFSGTAWYNNQSDGVVYIGKVAYNYKGEMPEGTHITIQEGTKGIAAGAFGSTDRRLCNTRLKGVTIPNGVLTIGYSAFGRCYGLTSIDIPNSVTSIDACAFYECNGLESISIGTDLKSVGVNAFYHCGLSTIVLHCQSIGNWFRNISSIKEVILGDKVTTIDKNAFSGCSNLTSIIIPKNVASIGTKAFPEITTIFTSIGKSLLALWNAGYYDIKEIQTSKGLIIPTLSVTKTTASSIELQMANSYPEYNSTVKVTDTPIALEEGNIILKGLNPNTQYEMSLTLTLEDVSYTTSAFPYKTEALTLITQQPKVISMGNAIVSAKSNLDDEETNVGFEWRRTDWTYEFASNTGAAYLYEGKMEGYIRNLYTEKLWKYRPYYESDSGNRYYGEWVGIDPTNTSYFEPTVHTYAQITVTGNKAEVKGYVMRGTDNVLSQGFMYWPSSTSVSLRKRAISVPGGAMVVNASGYVMTATLEDLEYEATYNYVAFVTTSEGETFYGEMQTFSTSVDPDGINEVKGTEDATEIARYDLQGRMIAKPQKGINIIRYSDGTSKKVLIK